MQELIMKMILCLLVALALGFLFGWLVKRAFTKEKYEPMITELETKLADNKEALKHSEEEAQLIKEQFICTKDDLDISTLKATEMEEHLADSQTKVVKLEADIKGKESHIHEVLQVSNLLHTQLDDCKKELEIIAKKSHSQEEEMGRVKEHHILLQNQVSKLTKDKDIKEQEFDKLSIMIGNYKSNEQKLHEERRAQEGKVTELQATLNEKNIASLELGHKVKEIDELHIMITDYKANEQKLLDAIKVQEAKVTELNSKIKDMDILNDQLALSQTKLQQAEERALKYKNSLADFEKKITENKNVTAQEVEQSIQDDEHEGFFGTLEHAVKEDNSEKLNTTSTRKPTNEGFDFIKFAKKTLDKITKTGDDINIKADKVIQEYKDRK